MKRLYHMLSLLALTHLFALGGLMGYLFASGRLNTERIDQMASVLRGEYPEPVTTQPAAEPPPPPVASADQIARTQRQEEREALLSARRAEEKGDRSVLERQTWLNLQLQQEEIEQDRKRFVKEKKNFREEANLAGFERVTNAFARSDPSKAKELLMQGKEFTEPEVVRLMMAMDENALKKIVNECSTPEEMSWINRILNQIMDTDDEATTGGASPSAGAGDG